MKLIFILFLTLVGVLGTFFEIAFIVSILVIMEVNRRLRFGFNPYFCGNGSKVLCKIPTIPLDGNYLDKFTVQKETEIQI